MAVLRLIPVVSLLLGLSGWPAARPPEAIPVEPPAAVTETGAPAQPAVATKLYLPVVTNRFVSDYESPFGIVMYTTINNAAGQAKMRAAGAYWYTTDLNWAEVEQTPPVGNVHTYNWATLDQDAANINNSSGEIYVLINRNPSWASAYPSGPVTNTQDLIAFATAAAERYDGDGVNDAPGHPIINYWSFYAEPDNGDPAAALTGKGFWGHNPGGYAAMLVGVADAMHAANPNAKILIGGVAYDSFEPGGPFVESFLYNTLATLNTYPGEADDYIDAIAFHYYPINLNRWPSIREKGLEIRSIMNAQGVGQLELIVPEMGYWSAASNGSSELTQARVLVQMYVKGLSIGISHMDWFAPFDHGDEMESHGLFKNGDINQPKLAYTAYGTLAATLYGLTYSRLYTVSGGESYVFRGGDGREVTVSWATGATATAYFPTNCVRKTDLLGATSVIVDGGGGDQDGANGLVALALTQNHPVYTAACN